MPDKKLLVLFPGIGYTCETELLAAGAALARAAGYEVLALRYGAQVAAQRPDLDAAARTAEADVRAQLDGVDWPTYADIVFLSKSLGTVVAAQALRRLGAAARSLYLTPLGGALAAIAPGDAVLGLVSGGADKYIDWRTVQAFCAARGLPFLLVPGAGHRLTVPDDAAASAAYAQKILALLALKQPGPHA